jgi:ABC-2 type transport system permease protein
MAVPAFLLVILTASCVGYAIASVAPPMVTAIVTQALVVFILMFSPLMFPSERLPAWLQAAHDLLPVQAMGEVIRRTSASLTFPIPSGAFLLLAAWCVGGFAIAFVTLNRRA